MRGQDENEPAAFAVLVHRAFRPDFPAFHFDQFFRDGQSQSDAFGSRAVASADLFELCLPKPRQKLIAVASFVVIVLVMVLPGSRPSPDGTFRPA